MIGFLLGLLIAPLPDGLKRHPRLAHYRRVDSQLVSCALEILLGGWIYYKGQNEQLMEDLGDEWGSLTPAVLTPDQEAKVRELLEVGGLYVTMAQYAAPPGDNAFDAYRKVLEIDPRNETARDSVRKIADYYEGQARIALDRHDYVQAKAMIELGLYVRPAHKVLRELQEELRNRQDGRQ